MTPNKTRDETFSHACKGTCSGWQDGYDARDPEIEKLREENQRLNKKAFELSKLVLLPLARKIESETESIEPESECDCDD